MPLNEQSLAARMKLYDENRSRWTDAQLRPYVGQWVFFSLDGKRVLAHAADLGEAYRLLSVAGFQPDETVLDHIVECCDIEIGLCETESA
jgi:hypothetical protein